MKAFDRAAEAMVDINWSPPSELPPEWSVLAVREDGVAYRHAGRGLTAIVSCAVEQDGHHWLHLSVSHAARLPTWAELVEGKELFLGDREAYKVLPHHERYASLHPNVLHLFARVDGSAVLPDFTWGSGSL